MDLRTHKHLPRGLRNNNVGNIRKSGSNWKGKVNGSDQAFETFKDVYHGIRALYKLLNTYYNKYELTTIQEIIERYAPNNENNTQQYINYIVRRTGILANQQIQPYQLKRLIRPIIEIENGLKYAYLVPESAIELGIAIK